MFNLFMILIGSVMIGFGTDSVLIGCGVGVIAVGFQVHINQSLLSMHNNIIAQMRKVYEKVKR